ncbi:MAG: hypothetical protein ACXVB9_06155 [Bdellovibrionota bacterium]
MRLLLCALIGFSGHTAFAENLNNIPGDKLVARCQGVPFPRLYVASGDDDIYRTSEYHATDPVGNCEKDQRALQVRIGAAVIAGVPLNIRLDGNSPLKDFAYTKTLQLKPEMLTARCRQSSAWDESGFPVLQVVSSQGLPDGKKALIYETSSYNLDPQWKDCQKDADNLTLQFNLAKVTSRKIVFKHGNSPKKDFRISDAGADLISVTPVAPLPWAGPAE